MNSNSWYLNKDITANIYLLSISGVQDPLNGHTNCREGPLPEYGIQGSEFLSHAFAHPQASISLFIKWALAIVSIQEPS